MKSFIPPIIIVICIATYYMYISPTYVAAKVLAAKKSEYSEVLKKSQELIEKRDALLQSYSQIIPEDIDRLQKIIPDSISSVEVVSQVNALASPRGLQTRSVSIASDKQESPTGSITESVSREMSHKTTNVNIVLVGRYQDFTAFLRDLELNTRLSDVYSLTIKPSAKSTTGTDTYEFTMGFRVYSL